MVRKPLLKIGLTGGIGSGKSTVADSLQKKGILIIDADRISRELTGKNGRALAQIKATFGEKSVVETGMNRDYMRGLILSDNTQKWRLEQILHPMIRKEMQECYEHADTAYVVFDIPLLIESIDRYKDFFDHICVVDCDPETQINRVMARSHYSRDQVMKIIALQAPRTKRLEYADAVIHNDQEVTLLQLEEQVNALHERWLHESSKKEG
ncbi:dephospho-CoA kinase [Basilea psittacipulmonis]|uniref:Dephospho-CoA kinase n=1 Tax=Basilea psittacipulmonis DSM 24701 TaxID=1072685 RepID=A0A077DEA0_9BURK|nr:dephospho-CoA kinase [Basilea psittacipulmonis]AIL33029.1 hypothetical protein IX83_06625 [Basilea psittacipulmonis DSM 24701]